MKCNECGGTYIESKDILQINDVYVGKIVVECVPYFKCNNCQDILYTDELVHAIESRRTERINELINQYPVSSFINASQAASLLGITRQALNKNRRIKHGFIYQTKACGGIAYLKQSVQKFKDTGDGRFSLFVKDYNVLGKYSKETVAMKIASIYNIPTSVLTQHPFFNKESSFREGAYANSR